MMSEILKRIKQMARSLTDSAAEIQNNLQQIRDESDLKEREIRKVELTPVPNDLAFQRIVEFVNSKANACLSHGPVGPMSIVRSHEYGIRNNRIQLPDPSRDAADFNEFFCLYFGPQIIATSKELLERVKHEDTLSPENRTALLEKLRGELAALQNAEDEIIETAEKAGISIPVSEKRRRQLNAQEALRARAIRDASAKYRRAKGALTYVEERQRRPNMRELTEQEEKTVANHERTIAIYEECEKRGRPDLALRLMKDKDLSIDDISKAIARLIEKEVVA
jgi:hypothetical protein